MADNEAGQPDTQETGQPVDQAVTPEAAPSTPSEIDQLKALLAAKETELERLNSYNKSVRGMLRKDSKDQTTVEVLRQEVAALNELIPALVAELSADSTVPQKYAQLRQKHEQQRQEASQTVKGQMNSRWADIRQVVAIAHRLDLRTQGLDAQKLWDTKREWAEVKSLVEDAFQQDDVSLLDEALIKAYEVRTDIAIGEAVTKTRKEVEAMAQEKLTRAGVFSTAAASTAAAGNGKRTEFTQEEIETGGPEFVRQHFDEIKAAQRAGRIK